MLWNSRFSHWCPFWLSWPDHGLFLNNRPMPQKLIKICRYIATSLLYIYTVWKRPVFWVSCYNCLSGMAHKIWIPTAPWSLDRSVTGLDRRHSSAEENAEVCWFGWHRCLRYQNNISYQLIYLLCCHELNSSSFSLTDEETLQLIQTPRCSLPDDDDDDRTLNDDGQSQRMKRAVSTWTRRNINWRSAVFLWTVSIDEIMAV